MVSQTALQDDYPSSSSGVFQLAWSPFGLLHSLNHPYGTGSQVTVSSPSDLISEGLPKEIAYVHPAFSF